METLTSGLARNPQSLIRVKITSGCFSSIFALVGFDDTLLCVHVIGDDGVVLCFGIGYPMFGTWCMYITRRAWPMLTPRPHADNWGRFSTPLCEKFKLGSLGWYFRHLHGISHCCEKAMRCNAHTYLPTLSRYIGRFI